MPLTKAAFGRVTLLLLAIGLVALLGLGAGLVWLVGKTRDYAAGVASAQQVRLEASQVLGLIQDAESGQRGYLLTGDERYLTPYRDAVAALPQELSGLVERVLQDGGVPGPLQQFQTIAERKLAELRETVDLASSGRHDEALALVRTGRGETTMNQIREALSGIEARSFARLEARRQGLDRTASSLLLGAAGAFGLIALVAAGSAILALRYARDLERARAEVEAANAGLEERVVERTAALEAANEEVQRFAYIVSHDLRAPLVNVMGFTTELETAVASLKEMLATIEATAPELLTAAAKEAAEADIPEAIGFIRSSTQRMDRLINAILRLSREGRRNLVPERVRMNDLVGSIADTIRHQLEEAGGEIRIEGSLPDLVTDRIAAEQIFGNLIDNATKYLDPSRPGRILVRGRATGRRAVFEVEDNGRGIDPRDHARIFELFRRSGAQDRPGEGIGLAHVRALARRLGGDVTVESAPGRGSVFRVTLPLVTRPEGAGIAAVPAGAAPGERRR
jgi:signal transduction histidine kinase